MSSTVSGIASSRASTSVRVPNRPARLALPPAKRNRVGASRQPSALPGQLGRADQLERPPVERAAAAHPVAARRDLGDQVEGEVAAARAGDPRPDLADAAAQARRGVDIGDRQRPAAQAPRHHPALDRGPGRIEQDDALDRAAPDHDRRRPDEAGVARREIDRDPLVAAERVELQPPVEPAAGDVEHAEEAAGIGAQRAARPRARDVQRRDLDDRRLARAAAGSRRCR